MVYIWIVGDTYVKWRVIHSRVRVTRHGFVAFKFDLFNAQIIADMATTSKRRVSDSYKTNIISMKRVRDYFIFFWRTFSFPNDLVQGIRRGVFR